VKAFLSTKGHQLIKRLGIGLGLILSVVVAGFLLAASLYPIYIYDLFVLGAGSVLLINLPHLLLPPQVFGRWKGDYYRERLEWEAFRNFLSDLAMMKKYAPEDLVLWRDWLLYAVALGVAERVEKAMEELHIKIPAALKAPYLRSRFHRTYAQVHSSYRDARTTSGGGGLGGGFGAGGGFGGGGAGGR